MRRAVLIHWKPDEGAERLPLIEAAGWEAQLVTLQGGNLASLRESGAAVFVIDLSRLPSNGSAVGQALRQHRTTRHVPLVFVGGAPEKVSRVREVLPDAMYCAWDQIATALRDALGAQPEEPVVPPPMAGYSGTPLAKKLGIKPGTRVSLVDAPQGFVTELHLPDDVSVAERLAQAERILLFIRRFADLKRRFDSCISRVPEKGGGLWVIWPKKSSGIETDVTEPLIRAYGMERGWVDYKVCAVDETWSGLLFGRKRAR